MSFDTSQLDEACLDEDFSDDAIWFKDGAPLPIRVIFSIGSDYEDDEGVSVRVDDKIIASTTESSVKGMKRQDILKIKNREYSVIGFDPDGSGWTDILLRKK